MSKKRGREKGRRFIRGDVVAPDVQRHKPQEPAVCPECGASVHKGRWTWERAPDNATERLCPACLRINNEDPAGIVSLRGAFLEDHHEELMHLIRHLEEKEKAEHPLKRIMSIEREAEGMIVKTTDDHLARTLGEALHQAYEGKLDYHFTESSNLFRVTWER